MYRKVIIYKSRKKAAIITVVSLALALAAYLILRYAADELLGRGLLILSILCLVFGVGSFYDRKPCIVLTEQGITEMTTVREQIEWDAILYVDDFFYRGEDFVRLLTDRAYKPALIQPGWFERFDRLYEESGLRAVYIRTAFLEVSSIQIVRFIGRMTAADCTERKRLLTLLPREW